MLSKNNQTPLHHDFVDNKSPCTSVAIHTDRNAPNPSAMVDIKNTIKGMLIPGIPLLKEMLSAHL